MNVVARAYRRIRQLIVQPFRRRTLRRLGMTFYPPNYVYVDSFGAGSVVADVGCGYEAEFSRHMIATHGLTAFGVDPTRKHADSLRSLVQSSGGKFLHLPLAVTQRSGTLTFHESRQNESGSILPDHTNVRRDETVAYDVEAVSLAELRQRVGRSTIDFLKLDLEGAEYDLLSSVTEEDLRPFKQVFVEFHHHCTNHTVHETNALVRRIANTGFEVFTLDEHNYLFYR